MSINFDIPVSERILARITRLDRFQAQWSSRPPVSEERWERLREATRIQSVAAACRLSGIRVTDFEVAGLLRGESTPLADADLIRGYSAALDYPFPDGGTLFTSRFVRTLHAVMMGAARERAKPTPWREETYHREVFDSEGKALGRVFPTLAPRMIASKVEDLLTWLEFELRSGERHPLLVIGSFVLGWLAISPFERGSARLGRALYVRLLERAGYSQVTLSSVEAGIEEFREEIYAAYSQAQTGVWSGESEIEPWLDLLLQVLDRNLDRVEAKLSLEMDALEFPPLQQAILETIREHGSVGAGLLLRATGANRNTLKDNLRRLVDRGVLEKMGERRGTRYRLSGANLPTPVAVGGPTGS